MGAEEKGNLPVSLVFKPLRWNFLANGRSVL